jgi:hypothetical protein
VKFVLGFRRLELPESKAVPGENGYSKTNFTPGCSIQLAIKLAKVTSGCDFLGNFLTNLLGQ